MLRNRRKISEKHHMLTDVKNEGEKFTTELSETEKKLFELETQLNLVDYVDQFVSNNNMCIRLFLIWVLLMPDSPN